VEQRRPSLLRIVGGKHSVVAKAASGLAAGHVGIGDAARVEASPRSPSRRPHRDMPCAGSGAASPVPEAAPVHASLEARGPWDLPRFVASAAGGARQTQ